MTADPERDAYVARLGARLRDRETLAALDPSPVEGWWGDVEPPDEQE